MLLCFKLCYIYVSPIYSKIYADRSFCSWNYIFFVIRDYYLEQNEDKQSREQEKKKKPSNTKLNCINQK